MIESIQSLLFFLVLNIKVLVRKIRPVLVIIVILVVNRYWKCTFMFNFRSLYCFRNDSINFKGEYIFHLGEDIHRLPVLRVILDLTKY